MGSLLLVGLFINNISYGEGIQWWLTGTGQSSEGNYVLDSKSSSEYLSFGAMARGDRWALSINVPFVSQKNGRYTQINEIIVEVDNSDSTMGGNHGGHMGGNMNDDENTQNDPITEEILLVEEIITPNREYGIGDIYLFGNYKLIGNRYKPSGIYVNTQFKIPVASFEKGLGTGEFDYGLNISFRQILKTYNVFGDFGYLVIGDPNSFEFIDPLTLGIGIGKTFHNGRYYASVYYQQYSKIIENYEAPRQLSLGINYRIKNGLLVSIGWIKGFSETSPDRGLRAGIQVAIK